MSAYPFPPNAPLTFQRGWRLFLAKMLGKTFDEWHGRHHIVVHWWRNVLYCSEMSSVSRDY